MPALKDKKPTPEDKKFPPEAPTPALGEEQKQNLLETQVQVAEETPEGRVAPQVVQEEKPPQTKTKTEDFPPGVLQSLPEGGDGTTQKMKDRPQAVCTAKPDQVEPGKEKTVSYVFLTLQSYVYNLLIFT